MLLQTTWFGTFLLDGERVVEQRLFPKDPKAIAERLASIEAWKVLDEERELLAASEDIFVTEPRLERAGGHFTTQKGPFLEPEAFGFDRGLLHAAMVEFARMRMRKAIGPEDHLRQAVAAMDDLLEQENALLERLREWYGLHFPELAKMVDEVRFVDLVATHGRRENMPSEYRESVGAELAEPEERELREMAELARRVADRRKRLEAYIDHTIRHIAPNVAELAGPMIAARLVSLAGGIRDLAQLPAGTIQVLGAEKALFRHLRTGSRPPKHGVLFQHPLVHRAPPWQRGAIARAFAAKIAMAARADAYTHRDISATLREALEKALSETRRRKEEKPMRPSTPRRPRSASRRRGKTF